MYSDSPVTYITAAMLYGYYRGIFLFIDPQGHGRCTMQLALFHTTLEIHTGKDLNPKAN